VTHPGYDADTVDNDVALLRLPVEVRPDKYRGFACLPRHDQQLPPAQQLCTIIGWGKKRSSDAFGTDILHEATVFQSTSYNHMACFFFIFGFWRRVDTRVVQKVKTVWL
jgi:hypothetical protein